MDDRFPTVDRPRGAAFRSAASGTYVGRGGSLPRIALAAALTFSGSSAIRAEDARGPRPQRLPTTAAATNLAAERPAPDRQQLARLASREILQRNSSPHRQPPPVPLAKSTTAQHLERRSEQLTLDAELALRRGAFRSARASILEALRTSAAAVDLQSGCNDASEALEQAITAIREAGDLTGRYGQVGTTELQRMVQSHQTPVLHDCRFDALTPYAAADLYLDFARESFTRAAAGRRETATTLLWLSRIERAHGELHGGLVESVSLTCLRAAVGVDPHHPLATNELGYRAMRLGLLKEAQWALERSLALQPNEPALRNLIETHRLAGNTHTAQTLVALLPSVGGQSPSAGPRIVQVEPGQFAAISPPVQPPAVGPAALQPPQREAVRPGMRAPAPAEAKPVEVQPAEAQPAADGTYSVLERVAAGVRNLWK